LSHLAPVEADKLGFTGPLRDSWRMSAPRAVPLTSAAEWISADDRKHEPSRFRQNVLASKIVREEWDEILDFIGKFKKRMAEWPLPANSKNQK
jgi:hypothetical protein